MVWDDNNHPPAAAEDEALVEKILAREDRELMDNPFVGIRERKPLNSSRSPAYVARRSVKQAQQVRGRMTREADAMNVKGSEMLRFTLSKHHHQMAT